MKNNINPDKRYEEIRQGIIRTISFRYMIPSEELIEDSIEELLLLRKRLYVSKYLPTMNTNNIYNAEDLQLITDIDEQIEEVNE